MLKFCPLYFNLIEFSMLLWGLWCVNPINPYVNFLRIISMLVCVNMLSKILTKIVMQKRRNLLPMAVMFQSSFPKTFSELLLTLLAVPTLAYVGAGDLLTYLDSNCTNYYEVTVMRYANVVCLFEGEKNRDKFLDRCATRQADYGAVSEKRNKFAAAYKQYYAYVMLRRLIERNPNYGSAVLARICDKLEDFDSADYYYSVFENERAKTIGRNLEYQKVVAAARVRRLMQFVPKQKLVERFPEMAAVLRDEELPATMYQNAIYICPTTYGSIVLKDPKTWCSKSMIRMPVEALKWKLAKIDSATVASKLPKYAHLRPSNLNSETYFMTFKRPLTMRAAAHAKVRKDDYSDYSFYESWRKVSLNYAPLDQQVRANDADLVHGVHVFMSRADESLISELSGMHGKLGAPVQGFVQGHWDTLVQPSAPLCSSKM